MYSTCVHALCMFSVYGDRKCRCCKPFECDLTLDSQPKLPVDNDFTFMRCIGIQYNSICTCKYRFTAGKTVRMQVVASKM